MSRRPPEPASNTAGLAAHETGAAFLDPALNGGWVRTDQRFAGLPEVAEDMDEIDDDRDLHPGADRHHLDSAELFFVAVDDGHPAALQVLVPTAGFHEGLVHDIGHGVLEACPHPLVLRSAEGMLFAEMAIVGSDGSPLDLGSDAVRVAYVPAR